MAIDSHMHINSVVLKDQQKYIEDINKKHSIKSIINIGLNIESSKESILISRKNRNAATTDRESAIIFGLSTTLIEGIFVGRKIENDEDTLNYIKSKLPNCYICNLDGIVIK